MLSLMPECDNYLANNLRQEIVEPQVVKMEFSLVIMRSIDCDNIDVLFSYYREASLSLSHRACVRFRVHSKRQQAQSINISKHPSKPTSINLNTTIHTLI